MRHTLVLIIVLFVAGIAYGQDCQTVEDCRAQLSTATQIANKAMDTVEVQKTLIAAQSANTDAIRQQVELQKAIIEEQKKLIEELRKLSRRKVSFLFGLVKVTY